MKVIVFGGTGWVGSRIAGDFYKAGFDTVICSRGKNSLEKTGDINDVPHIKADKSNSGDMAGIFENKYDIVIDSVPTASSIDNVFKYARGIKHYIHCSSTGGYAPLPFIPGDETMPYTGFPHGGGWTQKAEVDAQVMNLFNSRGFPATVIRPCYISGPGMLPLDNQGGRRADFVSDILGNAVLDLPDDGQALLQPVHIDDLSYSFVLAAEHPESIGQIYNICLKKAVTLTRYLEISTSSVGREAKINYMPLKKMLEKYGDSINQTGLKFLATHMCFDITKAQKQLDYNPRHTSEETIEENILWAKKQSETVMELT